MKNKFGFSIKDSDTEAINITNELAEYASRNGLSFSYIVTEALKEIAPRFLGAKNDRP